MLNRDYDYTVKFVRSALTGEKINIDGNVNYKKIYGIGAAHCITSLVYRGIKNCGVTLDAETEKLFINADKVMTISSTARNGATDRVLSALKDNNIECVLLKGAVFQNMYPEKHMRYSTDTDILVREKDFDSVHHIIKNLGLKFDSKNDKHDVFLIKPYICIEVHKKLVSSNSFFDSVWDNTERYNENALKLRNEYGLAYLVYHMKEDFTRSAGIGIHSVTDLWLYMRNYTVDTQKLEEYLKKLKCLEFYRGMVTLGEIWFVGKESDDFYDDLSDFVISGNRGGNIANVASMKFDGKNPGFSGKALYLLKKIFLPYKELKKIYPALGKCPPALPFFWVMRICGIIFRPEHHGFSRAKKVMKQTDKKRVETVKNISDKLELN